MLACWPANWRFWPFFCRLILLWLGLSLLRRFTRRATATPVFRLTRLTTVHDVINLIAIDGFILHQRHRHLLKLIAVIQQYLLSSCVALVDNVTNFLVNQFSGLTRDIACTTT